MLPFELTKKGEIKLNVEFFSFFFSSHVENLY